MLHGPGNSDIGEPLLANEKNLGWVLSLSEPFLEQWDMPSSGVVSARGQQADE